MPQISKALLSDAMYYVEQYRRKIELDKQLALETGLLPESEWAQKKQAEYVYVEDVLNQLRVLYESGGPRAPIVTGAENDHQ